MKSRSFVFLLAMVVNHLAFAETVSGRIADDDEVMQLAYVTLYELGSDVIINTAYSDINGMYRISVSPGRYNLCVSADEYAHECVKDIVVNGADVVVDVAMTPSSFIDKKDGSSSDGCD
jgi:hypothetical protein